MSKITIVTAFFKIKREDWRGFERSDEQYFEHFKVWAQLKNKLILYVESEELKERVINYRTELGLGEQTIVNVIPNCLELESKLYEDIVKATTNPIQKLFRLGKLNPEVWNPTYNYIMLLKSWCVCDAIKNNHAEGMIAWIDFGYNHGGYPIDKTSDFSFEWSYDFPDKINMFTIQELDDRPIFEIVMSMDTYIMGGFIVAPSTLWPRFWELLKSSMQSLLDCGMSDDDQNIMLMAYRKQPEICHLHNCKWSCQLKLFGGNHLRWTKGFSHNAENRRKGFKGSLKKLKHILNCAMYALKVFVHMSKVTIH